MYYFHSINHNSTIIHLFTIEIILSGIVKVLANVTYACFVCYSFISTRCSQTLDIISTHSQTIAKRAPNTRCSKIEKEVWKERLPLRLIRKFNFNLEFVKIMNRFVPQLDHKESYLFLCLAVRKRVRFAHLFRVSSRTWESFDPMKICLAKRISKKRLGSSTRNIVPLVNRISLNLVCIN